MPNDTRFRRHLPAALGAVAIAAAIAAGAWESAHAGPRPAPNPVPTPAPAPPRVAPKAAATEGSLTAVDKDGAPTAQCPLKHTSVRAELSGFLARVTVTQEFENPLAERIEAVYTFPLSARAAVDDMTLLVGSRAIKGTIKRREEARQIYENARRQGHLAALLDQERPNIFTQAVANIQPKEKVRVTISYVETLAYEAGSYQFSFPMVVGPRYIPGHVPDAARIAPPVTPEGTRAGHDISVEVTLDAGVPIDNLQSASHAVNIERPNRHTAKVVLADRAVIPNKDFLLRYDVAGARIEDAVLTHRAARGGFFTLILQPPERVAPSEITPKELVFVLDTSGSMSGFPIEKAKEVIHLALENMHPADTFNLITFAGDTHILFSQPMPATRENIRQAQEFLASRRGSGGTEMMKAIRAALDPTDSQQHVRIVAFLTDGYVGNDFEIIGEVQRHPNARVFSFGIGSSVNRFLLDKMAEHGRGEVEYVSLQDDGSKAARRFHERMRTPMLTDIAVDWGGLPVEHIYPKRIPDLFAAKPLILHGAYTGPARGTVRLTGKVAGKPYTRSIAVDLPAAQPAHDTLAPLWARARIGDLMAQDYKGLQSGNFPNDVKEQIVQLGLEYRLVTQFTSFVAVEERTVTDGGQPRRIQVPVEMPEGVSYEGIFGSRGPGEVKAMSAPMANRSMAAPSFVGGGIGAGQGGGVGPGRQRQEVDVASSLPIQAAKDARSKLHPDLQSLLAGGQSAAHGRFVSNGKANVQIVLNGATPAALAQLKQMGFELVRAVPGTNIVHGRIAVANLEALARLDVVVQVMPLYAAR